MAGFDAHRLAKKLRATLLGAGAEISLRAAAAAFVPATGDDDDGTLLDLEDPSARDAGMAMIEAGFLVVAADGSITEDESTGLVEAMVVLTGAVSREAVERLFGALAELLARDGFRERLRRVAEGLAEPEARQAAFALALALYLAADRELAEGETDVTQAVLVALARSLGLSHEEVLDMSARWLQEAEDISLEEARARVERWDDEEPGLSDAAADAIVDAMSRAQEGAAVAFRLASARKLTS